MCAVQACTWRENKEKKTTLEPWVILACGGLAKKEDPENELEKKHSRSKQENQKNSEKVFSR